MSQSTAELFDLPPRAALPNDPALSFAPALLADQFSSGLAPYHRVIRQNDAPRAHLLFLENGTGTAVLRGTTIAFKAPAMLWLPSDLEGSLQVEAGGRGSFIAISEDFLTRTVASSPEAIQLRRTIDRFVLIGDDRIQPARDAIAASCLALRRELRTPGPGSQTLLSSHALLLCLLLWRSVAADEAEHDSAQRGDGPRLVGNFLQMVELHFREGWPIARYAAALGVTTDRLHAHCKREKGLSPRTIVHQRLAHEARTRLLQLDLPVEQIGYGLGFRDPGYFNRFFRKYQGISPGAYRRSARLEQIQRGPTFAAWP